MDQQTVVVDVALLGKMAGYIEILVKDPHSTIFAALSDIYRTFGLHEEAVAVAQKGIEMVPTYIPGFIALGRALAEKGEPDAATTAYRKALALDPVSVPALTGLASSCLGCGKSEEALTLLTRAQLIDPLDKVVMQLYPIVKKLSSTPFAVTSLLSRNTECPPPGFSSSYDESVATITGTDLLPPIATATLADIYIKQGFPEKSLKVLSDLLMADPENTEIRQRYDDLFQQIYGSVRKKVSETITSSQVMEELVEEELVEEELVEEELVEEELVEEELVEEELVEEELVEEELVEEQPIMKSLANEDLAIERVCLSEEEGRDALVSLYGRWLNAVSRRKADVH